MKKLSLFFILYVTVSAFAKQEEKSFQILPLQAKASTSEELGKSIDTYFKNSVKPEEKEKVLKEALRFQNEIFEKIKNASQQGPVKVKIETTNGFSIQRKVIIPSLIQREAGHPSNQIVATIIEPNTGSSNNCSEKLPATIMIHHILNDVPAIEQLGKGLMVLGSKTIFSVIHLPFYGDRTLGTVQNPKEQFLTGDYEKFRTNMIQMILDIHVLRSYFASLENVDQEHVSLTGISLGGVLGWTVGSFLETEFPSGIGMMNGGGNISNILFNRIKNRKDSEVELALKNQGTELVEENFKEVLAPFDPMIWAHRIHGKVFAISASRDDIVDYKNSVEPLMSLLKNQGSSLKTLVNDDTHSPSGGAWDKLKHIVFPIRDFIVEGSKAQSALCSF